MALVIIITVTSITLSCFSLSYKVDQSPADVIQRPGETAKIQCLHSVPNYNQINWYRQNQGRELTFMGYFLIKSPNKEKDFTDKIEMSGEGSSNGTLTIKNLSSIDKAVYFCAAYSRQNSGNPAYFGKGTKLTVLELGKKATGPQNITLQELSKKEKCKLHITLVCVVQNFYPDHLKIKWKIGGTEVTKGVATDNEATKNGNKMFDMSSRLKVSREQWNNAENTFTCTYTFFDGSVYITDFRTVKGTAVSGFNRDEHIKSAQMIKLGYGVFIAKSGLYGLIILVFVWRKGSAGK